MSIYGDMKTAIEGLKPAHWKFLDHEPSVDPLPDATMLTLRVRTVSRLPAAPQGAYQVTWVLTITSGYTQRQQADPQLFDDLIDFLNALDEAPDLSWLAWTGAAKGNIDDERDRLVYDIDLIHTTQKEG